jgi:hypothetical protein
MSEFSSETFPPDPTAIALQRQLARRARDTYRQLADLSETSPGFLLLQAHAIQREARTGSQFFVAGWCEAEAALLPHADLSFAERTELLEEATVHWQRAFDLDKDSTSDVAERALLAICQYPSFTTIASSIETGQITEDNYDEQTGEFNRFFHFLLERWEFENLRGIGFEALTSYFLHRSNSLRLQEPTMIATPASFREDHHIDPYMRVDVNWYNMAAGEKYGIQVKGGYLEPDQTPLKRRILLINAQKILCLPYTKKRLKRTINAIVQDDERYRLDLDMIALSARERVMHYITLPKYVGAVATRNF